MKIIVVSDIHGNLEALTSIPEDFDELWVLGDLVNYPCHRALGRVWQRFSEAVDYPARVIDGGAPMPNISGGNGCVS